MYKLYGSPKNRAGRVMWMLEELGAEYEFIAAAPHSDTITAISPTGKLPALTDGDVTVFDSTAILIYLADKHGSMTYPAGTPEHARLMSALCFAVDAVEQPLWTAAKHAFVLPEAVRLGDAVIPACHAEWSKAMTALEKIIGEGPFVMGDDFTIVDVTLGHLGGWGKASGFPAPPDSVAAYMDRVRARPGWLAVAEARKAA